MLAKNVLCFFSKLLKGVPAADDIVCHIDSRRKLDLCRLEDRIVFSAEAQAITPIDSVGGSDFDSNSIAVIGEPDVLVQNGSVDPTPQAALSTEATAATLAFPGAAGFGAYAKGGRGGDVYHVTNLNDNGLGSLRYGIESMTGPRTIVFDTSGTIDLESRLTVSQPFLTIAGQTAPGDGITIANHTFQIHNTHDIIVRYLRVRAGDQDIANSNANSHDTVAIRWSHDVIVDHVSMSWGIDETFSTVESENVTVQWSIISESLSDSFHPKGQHGLASLSYGGGSLSLHHNLYAHHDYRMPHLVGLNADVVNNVFYDWSRSNPSSAGAHDGEAELGHVNFANNVYVVGPSLDNLNPNIVFWGKDGSEIWAGGNVVDANLNGVLEFATADFTLHSRNLTTFVESPFEYPEIPTGLAVDAYHRILESSGASLSRDEVDTRVVQNVRSQTGGVIDSQTEVGGFPLLETAPAPIDTDQDGMPDGWEFAFPYLDPNNSDDRNGDHDNDGYTNFEEFLNSVVEPILGPSLVVSGEAEVATGEAVKLTVSDEHGSSKRELYQLDIDWNGDSRTDQTVRAPLGMPIAHVFADAGDYSVQIEATSADGQKVNLIHPLKVFPSTTSTAVDEIENEPAFSLSSQVFVGDTATLTLGTDVDGPNGIITTYRIDWNGDSRIDQSVSVPAGAAVEHLYHESGQYVVQVYTVDSATAAFVETIDVLKPAYALDIAGSSTISVTESEESVIPANYAADDSSVAIEVDLNGELQIDDMLLVEQNGHVATHSIKKTGSQVVTDFLTHDSEQLETAHHETVVVAPPALNAPALAESHQIVGYDYHIMRRFVHPSSYDEKDETTQD